MPRVSVVIPVLNAERYLSQAIDSILCQTHRDFEVLILDDGSSDRSQEITRQACAKDSRIVSVNGDHQGLVHWRNVGVNMAKGEFVAMMDSDDIAARDRLAHQIQFLDNHPNCCAVGSQATRIDCHGLPIDEWRAPQHHAQIDEVHMAGRGGAMINPSVMMRKSAVQQVGGYRTGFESGAEDYDLFPRLAKARMKLHPG